MSAAFRSLAGLATSRAGAADVGASGVTGNTLALDGAATLLVRREAKVADLLGAAGAGLGRLEASGVLAHRGGLWVIFDNLPHVARLDPELRRDHADTWIYSSALTGGGYEDLAVDPQTGVLFLLIEAQKAPSGQWLARVREFDEQFHEVGSRWLDAPLERENKGIEGLSCLRRDGRRFLLGLPEGNRGLGGKEGRTPGGGQLHVFGEDPAVPRSTAVSGVPSWGLLTTIPLPPALPFTDFSGISHHEGRLAVVSQETSALWVGRLDPRSWDLLDDGRVYLFPRDPQGRVVYGTIEGVSWLNDRELAVVSDKAKRDQPRRVRAKDQSVHIVALPS